MNPSLAKVLYDQGSSVYREIQEWRHLWKERISPVPGVDGKSRPLGAVGEGASPLQGGCGTRPSADHRVRLRRTSPLHGFYPYLFHTAFPEVPESTVRELAIADRLATEHLLSYDSALDRPEHCHPRDLLLAHAEYSQTLKLLYSLLPPGHRFWDYFAACQAQTWRAARDERLFQVNRLAPFPFARFRALAAGKTALLKTCSVAMCFLTNREAERTWLGRALDDHHLGLVLLDDLEDWREDYTRGNFTFLLARLLHQAGLDEQVRHGARLPLKRLGSVLYGSGLAERHLRLAEAAFRRACHTPEGLPLPCWKAFNQGFQQHCRRLRHDFVEIRRRGSRAPIEWKNPIPEEPLLRAIAFLVRNQQPDGSFTLCPSVHAYLVPAGRPRPSAGATRLVIQALSSMPCPYPPLRAMLRKAVSWLRQRADQTLPVPNPQEKIRLQAGKPRPSPAAGCASSCDLVSCFEQSFPPERSSAAEFNRWEDSGLLSLGIPSAALFAANLLYCASGVGVRLPKLEASLCSFLRASWLGSINHGLGPIPIGSANAEFAPLPLLTLLPLCLALEAGVNQQGLGQPLHAHLLNPYRCSGAWGNPTDTALRLICLLATGYLGPELHRAAARLGRLQNPDGSWSPNPLFRENRFYFGSREVTSAWCLLALSLYRQACATQDPVTQDFTGQVLVTQTLAGQGRLARSPKPSLSAVRPSSPQVISHPGLPVFLSRVGERVIGRWLRAIPHGAPLPGEIYLGSWPGMPPHFLIPDEPSLPVAVNLREPLRPLLLSTSGRLLVVEMVLALVLALRCRLAGRPRVGIEWVYTVGAGLWACEQIWPARVAWRLAGLGRLEWHWCQEQEPVLWEMLLPFLGSALPGDPGGFWPQEEPSESLRSLVRNSQFLVLGRTFFEAIRARSLNPDLSRLVAWEGIRIRREMARSGYHA